MREFTKTLERILTAAAGHLELLPATGGAVEEMTNTDDTERDDTRFSAEHLNVDTFLETPTPNWTYRQLRPLYRKDNHLFKYFLDGSFRHYFIATGLEHDRSTPIFLAQTSLSILERDDLGKLKRIMNEHKWVMMLSKGRISETAWNGIKEEAKKSKIDLEMYDLAEEDPVAGKAYEGQNLRERGRGKTRYLMSKAEFQITDKFREKFPSGWMIKDGLLSLGSYGAGMSLPGIIAVAKSFTTTQKFTTRDGAKRKKENISTLLTKLPPNHRTPVYEGYAGNTGFWYLRLRESTQLQYPLFGVIKVEIPNISEQSITTELIDGLSSALLAEQFVTPYGSDERWHTHLYPIYQAEQSAKQLFYSTEVIRGCIDNALRRITNE
ncbi:MAG: hypothetical protein KAW02_00475 [candidate division Zixibacteria bacterium]|nr:hypothetical protein [candidate division Zixibacteria bacterium]